MVVGETGTPVDAGVGVEALVLDGDDRLAQHGWHVGQGDAGAAAGARVQDLEQQATLAVIKLGRVRRRAGKQLTGRGQVGGEPAQAEGGGEGPCLQRHRDREDCPAGAAWGAGVGDAREAGGRAHEWDDRREARDGASREVLSRHWSWRSIVLRPFGRR